MRQDILQSNTLKLKSACYSIFITAVFDENDKIVEVFLANGKVGSCQRSFVEGIGRLISYSIQNGGNLKDISNCLLDIKCPDLMTYQGVKIQSCVDAIAKGILFFLDNKKEIKK